MYLVDNIRIWFAEVLDTVPALNPGVKPYVVHTLCRQDFDGLEQSSVVVARAEAHSFKALQTIGDFVFWKSSFVQGYEHQRLVEAIAQLAYLDCYRMTHRRLPVYEALADELPVLTKQINLRLSAALTTADVVDS